MKVAGITELKAHLSQYLAFVEDGGEVLITERGRAIARIVPEPVEDGEGRVARLRKAGIVKGSGKPLDVEILNRRRPEDPEGAVRKSLIAEREGRLDEMEKAGLIRRGRGGPLPESFFDPPASETGEDSLAQAVLDERDEGW